MGSTIKEQSAEIEAIQKKVSEQADKISSLQRELSLLKKEKRPDKSASLNSFDRFFSVDLSLDGPGIQFLLSPEDKYSKGVFAALAAESENNDPRRCPVIISAKWYDHNRFHSINSKSVTWTYPWKNSWFQVELTKGVAILYGFRLKKNNSSKLKSYKLICTDDSRNPESAWTILIEINEKSENEHENIYEF